MLILGIETSCDDTSLAILKSTQNETLEILSHNSFSQEDILKKWGGVVPEIAARNHLDKIVPLLKKTVQQAKIDFNQIDLIGVTTNPGLLGPLLTGINAAKTISLIQKTPILPVNHLYAHLEAIHLTDKVRYPYLGLLVSGGHSHFYIVKSKNSFELIGGTIDDAAGEAFDKGAKLMKLGYPGGKIIDEMSHKGDKTKFSFPIGIKNSKDCNLSFSGLKTSLRTFLEKNENYKLEDVCASYQEAIVQALTLKTKNALKTTNDISTLVIGGGVACNSRLREVFNESFKNVLFVKPTFCTDNGAMIANYALRNSEQAILYPESLKLDAVATGKRQIQRNK